MAYDRNCIEIAQLTRRRCTCRLHQFTGSCNRHVDSIEKDPSEANSDKHVPKSSINQNNNHSIYLLPCAYGKKYYTHPRSDNLDFLLTRKYHSEYSVAISKFIPFKIEPSIIVVGLENTIKNISSYAPNLVENSMPI